MRKMFVLLALLVVTTGAFAQDPYLDPPLDPVFPPLPDNIELLRLENGLEVILMRNPAQPMVGIYTQVKVGSAREDYRTSGMSHMLEHLLFNGSEQYNQDELSDAADRAGAYNNANTADFYTNYMMVLPAGNIETGLDLQSQMLFHSLIPEEKFEKEKGIVLGEIVQGRDRPGHFAETTVRNALYAGSSMAMPTLGTRSTIEHMVRDDVHAFYRTWYVPNNMVVTVAGNFDRDHALGLLETYYGAPAPGTLPTEGFMPAAHIDETSSITRRGGNERQLVLSFAAPEYGMDDYFPFQVLTAMLELEGSGLLTRVVEDLEDEIRPEFGVWWEAAPGFGRLNVQFDLKDATDPAAMYPLVQDALTAAVEMGLSEEDILGIARTTEVSTLLEREQLRMTGIFTAEAITLGGVDFFVNELDGLRAVTVEDVTRVLTRWLIDAPCQAVLIETEAGEDEDDSGMPGGMEMPEGMQMPPAMADAIAKMQAEGAAGEEDPAASAPVVDIEPLQVDRSVLPSGAVLVSQTNPDSPLTAIHLAVRGRALLDRDNAVPGALDVVHRLLNEGIPGCDKPCLARRIRELGAVIKLVDNPAYPMDDYYTQPGFSFIRIETAAAYGPEVLDLLLEVIEFATFDDDAFERVRDERLKALERKTESARSTANRMLDEALFGDHPQAIPPEGDLASLEALDFNQVRTVFRKAFDPSNLIFAVVGPATHVDLRQTLDERFSSDGTPGPGLPPAPVTAEPALKTATLGGEMSAVRLGSIFEVAVGDRAALKLLTAIISDRMGMDLRETRGLSYSVGASVGTSGGQAEFSAWINPPVERLEEGRASLSAFLADFDPQTITEDELEKIRSARTGRMMMRRLSSMGQAYYLAMAELDDDIPGYLEGMTQYDALTLADLQAAHAYLADMVLVEIVVD